MKRKSWTNTQIKYHTEAAKRLGSIKNEVSLFIKQNSKNLCEKDVIDFIKQSYRKHRLVNDSRKEFCIIAFGKNTSHVHYFAPPKSSKLTANSLVLLDIWARLDKPNAPYADMTWMFYYGKSTVDSRRWKDKYKDIQKKWKILRCARDSAINFIQNKLKRGKMPTGKEIDDIAHGVLGIAGFGENIQHTVGHSLGLRHPHGNLPGINWKQYSPIFKNIGYTIEPGIYFKSKFGLRTEIDFYINNSNKVIVTTPIQKAITLIDTK